MAADKNDDKAKALGLAVDSLNKLYGKGTVMKLGDSPVVAEDVIPSGFIVWILHWVLSELPVGV